GHVSGPGACASGPLVILSGYSDPIGNTDRISTGGGWAREKHSTVAGERSESAEVPSLPQPANSRRTSYTRVHGKAHDLAQVLQRRWLPQPRRGRRPAHGPAGRDARRHLVAVQPAIDRQRHQQRRTTAE